MWSFSDWRIASRSLGRAPAFTATAVFTLAAGIAASTVLFSIIRPVLLSGGPYPEAERLISISTIVGPAREVWAVSKAGDYLDWRRAQRSFTDLAAERRSESYHLTGGGPPLRLKGSQVTASYFKVLGVNPRLGRAFTESEEQKRVVVLSHGLWLRQFGGDPALIGRTIVLSDAAHEVVGIMGPEFAYPDRETDLWVPLVFTDAEIRSRSANRYQVIGRRRPGVSLEQANSDLAAIAARLRREYPVKNESLDTLVRDFEAVPLEKPRRALALLWGAVALVLIIGCANVAGMMMTRWASRRAQMRIRIALGATRAQLARELLRESLLLSLLAALTGATVAWAGFDAVLRAVPVDVPRIEQAHVDGWALAMAILVSLVCCVACGTAPAWLEARAASSSLGTRGGTADSGSTRLKEWFVTGEIALAVALVAVAGLLSLSLARVVSSDLGLKPAGLHSARYVLPKTRYGTDAQTNEFHRRLLEALRAEPGMESVAVVSQLPFDGTMSTGPLQVRGRADSQQNKGQLDHRVVSAGYFETMGMRLVRGRGFTEHDRADTHHVLVVDEKMARIYFPNEDPIGKLVQPGPPAMALPDAEIVGIVASARINSVEEASRGVTYAPYPQRARDRMALVVRSRGERAAVAGAIRRAVHAVDADQPIFLERTLAEVVDVTLRQRRFLVTLVLALAGVALALAAIGLGFLLAQLAASRTREFGIRMALGATAGRLSGIVAARSLRLVALGVAAGAVIAWAGARLIESFLYETTAADPRMLLATALALVAAAVAAAALPVWRVSRLDPATILRGD